MLAGPFDVLVYRNAGMFTHRIMNFKKFEALSVLLPCSTNAPSDTKLGVHGILLICHGQSFGCGPCLRSCILLPLGGSLGAWR
jgi:hypothetical protein